MNVKEKMFKRISLLLCFVLGLNGLFSSLPPASAASDIAVYLYQDFEEYTETGTPPSGFEMTGIADVKNTSGALNNEYTAPNGTSVALRIEEQVADQPDVGLAKRFDGEDLNGQLIFDFDMKLLDFNGSRFIEIRDSGNQGITLGNIGPDGVLKIGSSKVTLQPDEWQRLSFALNMGADTMAVTLYVNGVKVLDSIVIDNGNQLADINYLRIRAKRVAPDALQPDAAGDKDFTTLLDNMRVYEGTELKTMEELADLQKPDSLIELDNDLDNSVESDSLSATAAVYLYQDFEEYTKTGTPPSGFEMTGIADVKNTSGALNNEYTAPNGTSVALRIEETVADQLDVGLAKRFGTDDLNGQLIFDFDMKLLDFNGSRFIEIKDSGNQGITLGNIGPDGVLRIGSGKVTLQPDEWQRLSFALNMEADKLTVTLYVDGVKELDSIVINNSNQLAGINYLRIRAKRVAPDVLQPDVAGDKNFTTLLDNMRVYEGTELKTMEELADLQKPDSLMEFDNDLGISVEARLAGALAMMLNNPNALMDNVRKVNAFDEQSQPHKIDGTIVVPLCKVGELLGYNVQISDESASVLVDGVQNEVKEGRAIIAGSEFTSPYIEFISGEVMVPLDIAALILQKQTYTDYKGRGLIVIGDSAQPFYDELDVMDGNIKPQNNEKFYIEEAVKQIVYDRPSGEQAMNQLIANNAQHPRIIATASDFDRIKAMLEAGETTISKWYGDIQQQGEKHLAMSLPTDDLPDGRRMIGSRQVGPLVINLGMLYHLSDDAAMKEQYKQRIWEEVYTVSQFPSWNEDNEFLNTAEFMEGVAIAYDWLYDAWTPEQRQLLEDAIIQKGLVKSLEAYNKNVWWIYTYPRTNNWNAVCNGSTILALMAIGDIDKQIMLPSKETVSMHQFGSKVLDIAFNALEDYILLEFMPDGAWAEGPSYWEYTLEYIVRFIASMETALGTSYGYDQTPGFSKTAYFPTFLSGSVGSLNYGDASNNKVIAAEVLWIAKKYSDRLLASVHLDNKVKFKNAGSELEMLWYEPSFYMPNQSLELDQYFSGTEVATFRSKWDDPAASFLGLKAGNNVVSHGHYDLGSFVFEALGQQWAIDLGKDDYNLPGYSNYDKERLTYYRLNPEGHNTLVINPDGSAQQNITAFSKIEKVESKSLGGFAIANLTEAYNKHVSEAKRGFMLASNRMRATIQDEVAFLSPSTAYWFMHTEAEIEVSDDGQSAVFSKNGEKLWVGLNSDARGAFGAPVAARFAVMDAKPLPESPNPAKQHQNDGIRKLFVKLDDVKDMRLTVTMIPIIGDIEDTDTTVVPAALDQWSIADGDLIVPIIQSASVDGIAIEGFAEQTFTYNIALPLDYTNVPKLTFTYDQSLYQVQAQPAADVPGVTKLIVSSVQNPEFKSVYYFNYKLVPLNGEDEHLLELPIVAVTASASQTEQGNTEDKAIDGNFSTYWGAEGDQWIMLDLGKKQTVNSVGIAFIRGNERSFKYEIETSSDGEAWYKAYSGQSSGESLDIEQTYLRQHDARYIRIIGHGNSVNQWNSYAEVCVYQLPKSDPEEPGGDGDDDNSGSNDDHNGNKDNSNTEGGSNGNSGSSGSDGSNSINSSNSNNSDNSNNGNSDNTGNEQSPEADVVLLRDIEGHWAANAIERAVKLGVINGYDDQTFRPQAYVTRAEFVVMLGRALQMDNAAEAELPFIDAASVPMWAKGYVAQSVQAGIINGYDNQTFRPGTKITRVELTAMIVRALELALETDENIAFADADQIADWARPYIAAAVQAGVIKGTGNNLFEPNQPATRAEAVILILALLDQN